MARPRSHLPAPPLEPHDLVDGDGGSVSLRQVVAALSERTRRR